MSEKAKIYICSQNPYCSGYLVEEGLFKIKGYDGPSIECDKCSSEMHLKLGRFGKYFGCTSCKNTRKILKNGEVAKVKMDPIEIRDLKCDKVDDYYLLRDGERGLFLAASQFPKNREIRAIYVDELLMCDKKKLPQKYHYLFSAPLQDEKARRAIVRYDKNTEQHYVTSEERGKRTKWKKIYDQGQWK